MPTRRITENNSDCAPRPGPRPLRSPRARSNTSTCQPLMRRRFAVKRPLSEPPITIARGRVMLHTPQAGQSLQSIDLDAGQINHFAPTFAFSLDKSCGFGGRVADWFGGELG